MTGLFATMTKQLCKMLKPANSLPVVTATWSYICLIATCVNTESKLEQTNSKETELTALAVQSTHWLSTHRAK